jgi:hypothetical protein
MSGPAEPHGPTPASPPVEPAARKTWRWQVGRVLLVLALLAAAGGVYMVFVGLPASVEGDAPEGYPPPAGFIPQQPEPPQPEPPAADVRPDPALASRLAGLSLACEERPYPNKPGHVQEGPEQARPHRDFTPAFFGCFDWHSSVHGCWALARVLRLFPDLPEAGAIRQALSAHLKPELLTAELAFFREPRNKIFERPYGWGWLLRLQAELLAHTDPAAAAWRDALRPLSDELALRLREYLDRLSAPVRDGTHQNTAFSLIHALDYARLAGAPGLTAVVEQRARAFYLADRSCPVAYEPSGEDFLSPCLTEADLMRRVLPNAEFRTWLRAFLPDPRSTGFASLSRPPEVRDPEDPRIGHLIGLSWSRAWSLAGVASALEAGDPWREPLLALARLHRREAYDRMFGAGYGGEHWLASFALLALTEP